MRPHAELLPANEPRAAATFDVWNIDWPTVIDDLGGDEALLQELIDVFVATYPETLNEARIGLARADLAGVARVAHKLKGSVGNFGFGPAWEASPLSKQRPKMPGWLRRVWPSRRPNRNSRISKYSSCPARGPLLHEDPDC